MVIYQLKLTLKAYILLFILLFANLSGQELITNNQLINDAFKLALLTVDINTRHGILAAGSDYGGEWTRDISINAWNGVSLLRPRVAEQSLWYVTANRDSIKHEYWDKIIWAIAAYNHFLVNGDESFLVQAYACATNTIKQLEQTTFDTTYGLFMGPSVFNDGISAYPEPVYEPGNFNSHVLAHKNAYFIKCLSTNCVYYGAYMALYKMSLILKKEKEISYRLLQKAEALKQKILISFYNNDLNRFAFLIDQHGRIHDFQEALGISFAVIFEILEGEKAKLLIANANVSNFGITSITPDLPRYSKEKPGRHNNLIWPFINGFFALAALKTKNFSVFTHELFCLNHLALDEDKGNFNFREIYNPYSGKPDGGYQDWGKERPDFHWESCRHQTWSATAYISMVLYGIIGMQFTEEGIKFSPYFPTGIDKVELKNLPYRKAILEIKIKGHGNKLATFKIDGQVIKNNLFSSRLTGKHTIEIELQ